MNDYTKPVRRFLSPKRAGLLLGALLLALATGIVACTELVDANEPPASTVATPSQAVANGEVYMAVEDMPEIVGGIQSVYNAVEYPTMARKAGIEGTVYVQFTVNKKGNVVNAEIVRGVHDLLNAEALRVVKQLEFEPGRQDGEPVKVRMSMPITFKLPTGAPGAVDSTSGNVFMAVEDMPEIVGGMQSVYEAITYPAFARKAGIEGTVYVQFTVNEQGHVVNAKVVRGVHELLDKAALEAVRSLEFKPGRQDGEPVNVRMSIPIRFQLPDAKTGAAGRHRGEADR